MPNKTSGHKEGISVGAVDGVNAVNAVPTREWGALEKLDQTLPDLFFPWMCRWLPSKQEHHLSTLIFTWGHDLYHSPMWFPKCVCVFVIQEYATTNNQQLTLVVLTTCQILY